MNKNNKYKEFLDYHVGKSVCIVGCGESVLKHDKGKYIDSHDVVVRINRGYPYEKYRKHVGSRTDVWAFGMGANYKHRSEMEKLFSDRKYSIYLWWAHSWVQPEIANLPNHLFIPKNYSLSLSRYFGGMPPTTGVDTIHFYVKATEYKSLTLLGFDFYKTGYFFKDIVDYKTASPGDHRADLEEKVVQALVAESTTKGKKVEWFR